MPPEMVVWEEKSQHAVNYDGRFMRKAIRAFLQQQKRAAITYYVWFVWSIKWTWDYCHSHNAKQAITRGVILTIWLLVTIARQRYLYDRDATRSKLSELRSSGQQAEFHSVLAEACRKDTWFLFWALVPVTVLMMFAMMPTLLEWFHNSRGKVYLCNVVICMAGSYPIFRMHNKYHRHLEWAKQAAINEAKVYALTSGVPPQNGEAGS